MYRSIHLYWYRYRLSFSITVSFYWHRYGVFLKPYRKNRYWCIYITLSLSHWLSFNLPPSLSSLHLSHTLCLPHYLYLSPLSLFLPSLSHSLSFYFITLSFLFSFIHSRVISLIFFSLSFTHSLTPSLPLCFIQSLSLSLSLSHSLTPSLLSLIPCLSQTIYLLTYLSVCDFLSFTPLSLVYLFTYPFVFLSLSPPPPFLTRFVSMCLCFSLSPLLPLTLSTNSPICLFVFVSLSDSVYLFTYKIVCVCFSLSHPLSLWLSLPIYISVCLFLSLSLTLPTHSSICLCVFISFSHPYLPIQVSSLSPSLFDSLSTYLPIWGSKPLCHEFPPSVIWKSALIFSQYLRISDRRDFGIDGFLPPSTSHKRRNYVAQPPETPLSWTR